MLRGIILLMTRRIDISYKTVVFVTIFLLGLWIVYQILDILLLFFVAFIFMSALSPLAEKLVRLRVPRVIAVIGIFVIILTILVGVITIGLTPLVTQTNNLTQKLILAIDWLLRTNIVDQNVINQEISNLSGQIVNITVDIVKNIISLVSVIIVTLYMMLDKEKIEKFATSFFAHHQEKAKRILERVEDKLGSWLRGQMLLSVLIGVLVYVGLTILGLEYALPLAIFAAFLEVVPVIGPIISAIPAILIGLTVSPIFAGIIALLYFAIQQIEGHIVVPQVMKKAVGLNPLLVILAISIGGRLLGIGGALLAVPIAAVIQIVTEEILKPEDNLI